MKIDIYGRKDCSYCQKAKSLLDNKGISYNYYDVDSASFDVENLKEELERENRPLSLPVVYVNDEYVRGFEGLKEMFSETQDLKGKQFLTE